MRFRQRQALAHPAFRRGALLAGESPGSARSRKGGRGAPLLRPVWRREGARASKSSHSQRGRVRMKERKGAFRRGPVFCARVRAEEYRLLATARVSSQSLRHGAGRRPKTRLATPPATPVILTWSETRPSRPRDEDAVAWRAFSPRPIRRSASRRTLSRVLTPSCCFLAAPERTKGPWPRRLGELSSQEPPAKPPLIRARRNGISEHVQA